MAPSRKCVAATFAATIFVLSGVCSSPIFQSGLFEQSPQLAESHIEKIPPKRTSNIEEQPEDNTVPPPPTFVEQKVEKLIHKLFTLSQLASNFRESLSETDPTGEKQDPDRIPFEDYFKDRNTTEIDINDIDDAERLPISAIFEKSAKLINDSDATTNQAPAEVSTPETPNKDAARPFYQTIPSQIGVFVLELFASVIGLAVGAVSQINHALHQSNGTILEAIYNKTHF